MIGWLFRRNKEKPAVRRDSLGRPPAFKHGVTLAVFAFIGFVLFQFIHFSEQDMHYVQPDQLREHALISYRLEDKEGNVLVRNRSVVSKGIAFSTELSDGHKLIVEIEGVGDSRDSMHSPESQVEKR